MPKSYTSVTKKEPKLQTINAVYQYDHIGLRAVCTCQKYVIHIPGDARWCKHCEELVQKEILSNGVNHLMTMPVVVVLQKHPGVEVLVSGTAHDGSVEVYASLPSLSHGQMSATGIGFLNENEGIPVLRAMLMDWLAGFVGAELECMNEYHVGNNKFCFDFGENLREDPKAFANMVSLVTLDKCLDCKMSDIPELETHKNKFQYPKKTDYHVIQNK